MKKVVLFILALGLFVGAGYAQEKIKTVEKGDFRINPYVTLGSYDYGYSLDVVNIFPSVGASIELATSNYFSFGVEADYGFRRYRDLFFTTSSYEYDYTYKALRFRANVHYLDWLKDTVDDNLFGFHQLDIDLYAGIASGIGVVEVKERWNDGLFFQDHERKTFSSSWQWGYYLEARYYFNNNLGAFLEGGRNALGWAKLGFTLKI